MELVWHIVIFTFIFYTNKNVQGVSFPEITFFPKEDMDGKGLITKDFRIQCKATGDNVQFTWKQYGLDDDTNLLREYKRGSVSQFQPVVVEADGTLVAKRVIPPRDNGYYQCFAKNDAGTVFSRKLRLQITTVSDFRPNSEQNLGSKDKGTIVSIDCPPLKDDLSYGFVRSWGRSDPQQGTTNELGTGENRIIRAKDGQLTFSPLMQTDCEFFKNNGGINCKVEAANTFYTSSIIKMACSSSTTSAKFKPRWVQELPSTSEAIEGKEFNMYCAARGVPTPKVKWFFNDKTEIKDGANGYELSALKYNRFLKITKVNRVKHEGKYTCKATSSEGNLDSSTTLSVLVRPELDESVTEKRKEIPINKEDKITCLATGNPSPSYTWYQNGKPIPSSSVRVVARNNVLRFPRAELQDDGMYQCVASNKIGMVVTSTEVKVKAEKPTFKVFGPFSLFKGSNGKLACDPDAAPKADSFLWYYQGRELITNATDGRHFLYNDGTLVIKNVDKKKDEGKYKCKAHNIVGNTTSPEAAATVYEPTFIKVPPKNLTVPEGKVFDLRCEASYDSRLEIKYFWLRDGARLNNIENSAGRIYWDEGKNVLKVGTVKVDDGGEYTCVAFTPGPQSEARAAAIVNIKGVPDPPSNLAVTDCKELSTTLTWVIGPSNDSPITHFLVEQESAFEPNIFKMFKNVTSANVTSTTLVLTPWANLRFRVRAVNRFGPSRGSVPTTKGACITKETAPDKYPDNIKGVAGGPEELNITWTPLTKLEQNAPGCRYLLSYKRKDSGSWIKQTVVDCSVGVFKVDNAGYYIEWHFKIQVENNLGKGPESPEYSAFSGQDPPKFPPANLRDIKPGTRTVEITWDAVKIDPDRGRGSIDGYRVYYVSDGKADQLSARRRRDVPMSSFTSEVLTKDACANDGSCKHEFEGFKPFQKYRLVMRAFNSGGNGPPSDEVTFQTKEDVPSVPVDVNVIPFGKYILLRWGPPLEENGIMAGYSVGVTKTKGNQLIPEVPDLGTDLKPNQLEYLFEDLDFTTDYRVGVAGKTGAGMGPAVYLDALTVRKMKPAKPALPKAKGGVYSVNVTFEYGVGGGYPKQFMVKYREKIDSKGTTTPNSEVEYKESIWVETKKQRWVTIENLPISLHEFRTVGRNDEGSSPQSKSVFERPLPGILVGKRAADPFYATGWFIVLIVIIVLLLLVFIILVLVKKQRGAKYPVGKREKERAGILETFPEDEEAGYDTQPRDLENPPPYPSQGSLDRRSLDNDSDRDSLDDYGEGPQFNEDGSFVAEYGDDDKKNVPSDKDKQALATFV